MNAPIDLDQRLAELRASISRANQSMRLGERWRRLQRCLFLSGLALKPERRRRIVLICNRLAARIDAINPNPEIGPYPRLRVTP